MMEGVQTVSSLRPSGYTHEEITMNCPHCQRPITDPSAAVCPSCRKPLKVAPFGANPFPQPTQAMPTQMMPTQAMPAQPQTVTRMSLSGELIEEEVRVAPTTPLASLGRSETPTFDPEIDYAAQEKEQKVLKSLKICGGIMGVLLLFGTIKMVMGYAAQQQRFERSVTVDRSSPESVTKEIFVSFKDGSAVRLYKVMQFLGDTHMLAEAAIEFNKGYFEPEGEYEEYRTLAKNMTNLKLGAAQKHGSLADIPLTATITEDGKKRTIRGVAHLIQGPDDSKWRFNANTARVGNPGTEEHQIVRNLFNDLLGIKKKL